MTQNKVVTSDAQNRQDFKGRLNEKVSRSLTADAMVDSVTEVVVVVPANFHALSKSGLFGFLTRERALTPEQANDVLAILDGQPSVLPYDYRVVLSAPVPVERPVGQTTPQAVPAIKVRIPVGFQARSASDQYSYLLHEARLPVEHANDVIALLQGQEPLSGVRFTLEEFTEAVQENPIDRYQKPQPPAFTPLPKTRKPEPVRMPVELPPVPQVTVRIPTGFSSRRPADQYLYLVHEAQLSMDHANDLIAKLGGKEQVFRVAFLIEEFTEPATDNPVDRYQKPKAPSFPPVPTRVREPLAKPVEQLPPGPQITVKIPAGFKSQRTADQYRYLTREAHLSMDHANDVIDLLQGKNQLTRAAFTFEEIAEAPQDNPVDRYEKPKAPAFIPLPKLVKEPVAKLDAGSCLHCRTVGETATPLQRTIQVPAGLKEAPEADQLRFFLSQQLTGEQANDAVAFIHGRPVLSNIAFSIEETEAVDDNPVDRYEKPKALSIPSIPRRVRQEPVRKVVEATPPLHLIIQAPLGLKDRGEADQYRFFLSQHLTAEQANDAVASFNGRTVISNTEFRFEETGCVQDNPVDRYQKPKGLSIPPIPARIKKAPVEQAVKVEPPIRLTLQVPPALMTTREADQYRFFLSQQLTAEQANDAVAFINGRPVVSNVEFVVEELEP